ncbi:UDP-galactose 4-epimerase [Roseibium hamelinense]|uniref:UDP-glucose 4-epimerase n=1 Tax=Roseibium hamelinense TaxID=150831 RepID=A0A562TKD5_9HYPH|nr:UDP-glucose 4-epimerase GalE [Roseibium hamelinense]MTI42781.1 UDP-glucose 4-epimerase GalE [Roseibium hamelinense]TWI93430.1 UDP-galactose 4-epimerase [Roseibium hamelinense]
MQVLITGGAGYIGSHTVWTFQDAGETPVVLDNLTTGFDWSLPEDVPLYRGEVSDKDLVGQIIREHQIDAVIHFAGSIIVSESVANPLKYYRNNTVASQALLEACVENGVGRFVFSSTAAVYGIPDTNPVPEEAPLRPFTPYGTSKLMTERMLADTSAAHGLAYTALRYFNVSGADPKGRTGQSTLGATNLIKVACETAQGKRNAMTVFGTDYDTPDGSGVRDYIHVSDLAAAHKLALDRLRAGGESCILNCGYGRGFSVLEVVETVKQISNVDFPVEIGPRRQGDAAHVISDNSAILQTLAWKPQYADLGRIVSDALAWEQKLKHRNRI